MPALPKWGLSGVFAGGEAWQPGLPAQMSVKFRLAILRIRLWGFPGWAGFFLWITEVVKLVFMAGGGVCQVSLIRIQMSYAGRIFRRYSPRLKRPMPGR